MTSEEFLAAVQRRATEFIEIHKADWDFDDEEDIYFAFTEWCGERGLT